MAHTLDLSSARLQAGAVRGGALREAFGKLDLSRIAGESGAIAVHVAALMLLLAPMRLPPAPLVEEVISDFTIITPKDPPIPPPPVEVQIRTPTNRTPIAQPIPVEPPPIVVTADTATEIDLKANADIVVADNTGGTTTITEPLVGAHLEYEFAPPPSYSAQMMRAGIEGTVLLRVLVGTDGKPLDVTIERSSGHRELDQAARRQVLGKWRFKPAMQDGQTVQAIGLVPVDFKLNR